MTLVSIWIWDGKYWSLSIEGMEVSAARAAELEAQHNVEESSLRIERMK